MYNAADVNVVQVTQPTLNLYLYMKLFLQILKLEENNFVQLQNLEKEIHIKMTI